MYERHGMTNTPTHRIWRSMKCRCLNHKHKDYPYYGGRGITVCTKWIESFTVFHTYMGDRPDGMTIDRINNNGNYEPGNCKWSTRKSQRHNQRVHKNARFITSDGQTKTVTEWARDVGLLRPTLAKRLDKYGWSIRRALNTPCREGVYNEKN